MSKTKITETIMLRIRNALTGKNREWDQGRCRPLIMTARYFFILIQQMIRDQCFLRSSALAFTTLLTLIPILILSFVLFKAFGGVLTIQSSIEELLFRHLLPESVASMNQYIQALIGSFNYTTVSIVSVAFLIVSAYSLFASIDSSLNAIWGIHRDRSFLTRLINLWFILTVTPLAIGYSIYLSSQWLRAEDLETFQHAGIIRLFMWFLSVATSWIPLTLVYKFVPRTSVRWAAAALGGFCGALLWEISKYGFNFYVSSSSNLTVLYQSFTIIPIFLIWVDLSWTIFLIGAEIAYTHHHFYHLHITAAYEDEFRNRFPARMRQSAFALLDALFPSFRGEAPAITFNALAEQSRLPSDLIQLYLHVFQASGLVVADSRNHTFHLVKDPATVDLGRLIHMVDSGGSDDVDRNPSKIEILIREAITRQLEGMHLDDYDQYRVGG